MPIALLSRIQSWKPCFTLKYILCKAIYLVKNFSICFLGFSVFQCPKLDQHKPAERIEIPTRGRTQPIKQTTETAVLCSTEETASKGHDVGYPASCCHFANTIFLETAAEEIHNRLTFRPVFSLPRTTAVGNAALPQLAGTSPAIPVCPLLTLHPCSTRSSAGKWISTCAIAPCGLPRCCALDFQLIPMKTISSL